MLGELTETLREFCPRSVFYSLKRRKLSAVLGSLFGDEVFVVEVVDLHGLLHLVEGLGSDLAGGFGALAENLIHAGDVLFIGVAAGTDGLQAVIEHVDEELLALHVSKASTAVVVLELVQVGVLRQESLKVTFFAEGIEVSEYGVALYLAGIFHPQVTGVGEHAFHFLFHGLGIIAQVDAVAQGLAHLGLAIGTGQAAAGLVGRQKNFRLHQYVAVVDAVEAAHNLTALLQHGFLVFAGGNGSGLAEADIGSLGNRIGEETYGQAALVVVLRFSVETAQGHLGLHGRIALQALHGDQVGEELRHLMQLRHLALDKESDFLGVQAAGQVVQGYFYDILTYFLRVVGIVRKSLHVCDEHEHAVIIAFVLQQNAVAEGTNIMSQMKFAGRAVAC